MGVEGAGVMSAGRGGLNICWGPKIERKKKWQHKLSWTTSGGGLVPFSVRGSPLYC